jgi:DNA-binding SARP family transcriptional activator
MSLHDRLSGIIGDFVEDASERAWILNQSMYFVQKKIKRTAAIAFMIGVAVTVGILRYFA